MTVFIADDSTLLRERLIRMMAELSVTVQVVGEASDASEASEVIPRLKPDVVVLDISMPGGGGIDVLRKIRKNLPDSLIVMLTNYPYPQYRKRCMELGADFFFDKSTEFDQVSEVLRAMIRDRHS